MADKQPRQHDKKTLNLVLIAAFPLNTTMKKVNLLKLFIFPFVLQREHGLNMLFDIKIFRRKYFRNLFDVYVKKTFVFVAFYWLQCTFRA